MESKSIECRDPELEESFSFSTCYDFNSSSSSLAIFSDNDDDYIEIALQPPDLHLNNGADDEEMELRISFSTSCVPLSDETKTTMELYESTVTSCKSSLSSSSSSSSSSTFTFSSSSAESQRKSPEKYSKPIESKDVNRFVNKFISSLKVSASEFDVGNGRSTDTSHSELVPSSDRRKASKLTTTKTSNSFVMKFFIKFRTLKLKTLLASFLTASQDKGKLCEENFLTYNTRTLTKSSEKESSTENIKQGDKKSKLLELNFDAIRGVLLEAMSITTSLGRRDRRSTKSCPVSSKSSPIHQTFLHDNFKVSTADNSVQAAIAHCKRSFGPNI
ncbi:protein MTL1 isoform X2 [Jatropha curcas]|uniref:protein MTL1 isoform X2 n=1 Tax=Jatropha curcas TaxID=180498 RepID=UPI0005FB24FB|nr:protein MTL1 isoform X2 [Jatropha curcas]